MKVGFLVFDNVTQLDFTGPLQVLSRLKEAEIHIIAKTMAPVTTDGVLRFLPNITIDDAPQLDILVVAGGHGVRQAMNDKAITDFIARQAEGCRYVTSVCTGAFVLGKAGLLKGKKATTHWAYTGLLHKVGAIYKAARVVEDGKVITGGGVTAGIDFACTLMARLQGEEMARAVQLSVEYNPGPPFDGGTPDKTPQHIAERVTDVYQGFMDDFAAELDQ